MSDPPYASLNLGLHTGDAAANVVENRRRFLDALGMRIEDAVVGEQVHEAGVAEATAADRGRGARTLRDALPKVDALVTGTAGLVLVGLFADCLPIFFVNPLRRRVGLAHAGWRGTVAGVAQAALCGMVSAGGGPEEVWVALGPAIGPCCYEVGDEVLQAFSKRWGPEVISRSRRGRPSVDLALANRLLLVELGVEPGRIDAAGICTACRTDLFFSHRVLGPATGRMAAAIALGR